MWLKTRCEISFTLDAPTPFLLMLRPRSGAQQWVALEEYKISPSASIHEFTDVFGNLCQRLVALPPNFAINTSAEVMTATEIDRAPGARFVPIAELPEVVLNFLLPSRYCESDRLGSLAFSVTSGFKMGYDQVAAISRWVHDNIEYRPGFSIDIVSATEVSARGWGVCRDLSHLAIALCRSLSIPARLVVGYLHALQPMDLHAWFEAFVGGRWYTFDPTEDQMNGGYVSVGYGRDAADVAIYTQFGPPVSPDFLKVSVERIAPDPP